MRKQAHRASAIMRNSACGKMTGFSDACRCCCFVLPWAMPEHEPFDADLSAIHQFVIEVEFACGRHVDLPVRYLLQRYRGSVRLRQALKRFRCRHCNCGIGSAALIERADSQASGRGTTLLGWRIELEP